MDQTVSNSPTILPEAPKKRKRRLASESGPRKPKEKPVECPVCLHARNPKLMLRLSTCNCEYCVPCVREAFSTGLQKSNGIPNFPARCCGRVLDYTELEEHLTPQLRKAYSVKTEEMSSNDPLYCAGLVCENFIPENQIKDGFGLCGKCKKKTCTKQDCKRLQSEHFGVHVICPAFFEEKELNELAEAKSWKRCPKCCAWTERIRGCNDIRCICRTEWCYKCGKPIKGKSACICYAKPVPEPSPQQDDIVVHRDVVIVHDDDAEVDVKPSIEDFEMVSTSLLHMESDITAEMDRLEQFYASRTNRQQSNEAKGPSTHNEDDAVQDLDMLVISSTARHNGPNTSSLDHQDSRSPESVTIPTTQSGTERPTETLEDLFRMFTANKTLSPVPVTSDPAT